ncbi:MAG TPA: winged helix-turn-helix domain-containing protein [Fermentimonas sp.]|nr:winged helix-turn-helix domain-containing protein [Fermentimonas sp.]
MIEIFGINAGKVWTILDQQGKQNIKELKKSTKLTDKNLYAALGWLSREGKIRIAEEGKDIFVSLE